MIYELTFKNEICTFNITLIREKPIILFVNKNFQQGQSNFITGNQSNCIQPKVSAILLTNSLKFCLQRPSREEIRYLS